MAATPTFCTVSDFTARYDKRLIGGLVNDDGTQWTGGGNTNISEALVDAEMEITAAVTVGARYSKAQLDDQITNHPNSPSSYRLRKLTADLAFGNLVKRRGLTGEDFKNKAPMYAIAVMELERLRLGERIFPDIAGVTAAGLPETATMIPVNPPGPPLMTQRAGRYFGVGIVGQTPWGC